MSQCQAERDTTERGGPIWYCILEAGHEPPHEDDTGTTFDQETPKP